jgi:hypothetical protein
MSRTLLLRLSGHGNRCLAGDQLEAQRIATDLMARKQILERTGFRRGALGWGLDDPRGPPRTAVIHLQVPTTGARFYWSRI